MLEGSYSNLTVHLTKDYTYPASIYYNAIKLYTYQRILRYSILGLGIRQEYFVGKLYDVIGDQNSILSTRDKFISNYYAYYNFDGATKGSDLGTYSIVQSQKRCKTQFTCCTIDQHKCTLGFAKRNSVFFRKFPCGTRV